jgi:hypothetical protein
VQQRGTGRYLGAMIATGCRYRQPTRGARWPFCTASWSLGLIGQCAVAAGVGVDLGPIQCHRAHLQHPNLTCQQQHFDEQRLDLLEKPSPECSPSVRSTLPRFLRHRPVERHPIARVFLQRCAIRSHRLCDVDGAGSASKLPPPAGIFGGWSGRSGVAQTRPAAVVRFVWRLDHPMFETVSQVGFACIFSPYFSMQSARNSAFCSLMKVKKSTIAAWTCARVSGFSPSNA